jgi:hypothetical protein
VTENVLPDCRLARTERTILRDGDGWVPVFCANCSVEGPQVPAKNCTFAFWLCNACAGKWGELAGTYLMPDEVFFKVVAEESAGMAEHEIIEALKDDHHTLTKLARDRQYKE